MGITRDTLLSLMLDMSPGDRSMLEDCNSHSPSDALILTTTASSMNFRLWSHMVEFGWMVREPDKTMAAASGLTLVQFAVSDAGRAAMPKFLSDFKRYRSDHASKMGEIFNTFCLPFTKELYERIAKAGGRAHDMETLDAMIITQLVTGLYRPHHRLAGIERLLEQVKKNLSLSQPAATLPPSGERLESDGTSN